MDPQDPNMVNQIPNSDPDNTGKNDKVLTDDELNNLSEEELRAQLKTVQYQKVHWREKAQKANQDLETLKKPAAPPEPNPAPTPQPVVQSVDVEAAARKVAMDMKRDEMLTDVPEDKRATVKEFYDSLSTGKQIDVSNIGTYMQAAMRAAGLEVKTGNANKIISSSSGAVPPRTMPGPTPEQIELARKFGQDPAKVYGEKVDTSAMLNPEKFFVEQKKELI